MRLLDIGCGWGGLAQRAIEQYDASVLAITLSEEQYVFVKELFEQQPYLGKGEVRLCSYGDLLRGRSFTKKFDRVVSVGMFEHVGKKHYKEYFQAVNSLLTPGGLSLLHTLTKPKAGNTDPWIEKYIFPGGHIPSVSEVVNPLEKQGFSLIHMESLRRHYVKTLQMWHANYAQAEVQDIIEQKNGPDFLRMWDLYLRMAAAYLDIGGLDVNQFIFTKGVANDLPMTMGEVYG